MGWNDVGPERRVFDGDRFAELVLYVAQKYQYDPSFGAVRMAKALFYCDFTAYKFLGRPLTGATYQRLPLGPAPREYKPVEGALVAAGAAVVQSTTYYGHEQKRLVALRASRVADLFGSAEVQLIDQVLEDMRGMSAVYVSDLSHEHVGWIVARPNEDIPYDAVWIADDMSAGSQSFAESIVRELGRAV